MSAVARRARSAATCRLVWPTWRADHDQPVPAAACVPPDPRPAQRRPGPQAAERPHERRPGAEQERLALALGLQHAAGHRLQVGVLGGVDHHPRPARRAGQHLADPGRPAEPDVRQADAAHILRPDRPPALLRNENRQVRRPVPERAVVRELGLTDGDQPGRGTRPVDAGRGDPACFEERGNQQHAVVAAADQVPADRLQRGHLRHHVTAQRGVAPADQLDAGAAPARHRDQPARRPGGDVRGGRRRPGSGSWSARSRWRLARPAPRRRRPPPARSRPGRRVRPATRSGRRRGRPGAGRWPTGGRGWIRADPRRRDGPGAARRTPRPRPAACPRAR